MKYRVFFIEPQEDVDEITKKIRTSKNDFVALVFPRRALLFQSIIAIKILHANAEEEGKEITIVTRDHQAREFCHRLHIPWVSELEHLEEPLTGKCSPAFSVQKMSVDSSKSHKIKTEEEQSIDFEQKKKEILELLSRPSKTLLFSISFISLALLFFVSILALPGATILINPQKKVVETTINVTLTTGEMENATDSWRQYVVQAVPVESIFEKTIPFQTINKIFTGTSAHGEIIVKNTSDTDLHLRPTTRFQTEDGIVLRADDWVRIPPHSEKVARITADERDTAGDIIGERGNLPTGTVLFIPGLPSNIRGQVQALVENPITGGTAGYTPIVSKKDLEVAKKQITDTILRDAHRDSEAFVERRNRLENMDFVLVPGKEYFETEVLDIIFPENILGQERDEFPVRSRMRVRMIAFSESEMLSLLRGALEKSVDEGMELLSMEKTGIFPEVLSISDDKSRMKITVSVRGVEAFVIEPRTKEGVLFVNRVKKAVIGKSVSEAKKILMNFPEVAIVNISLWPPLLGHLPHLPENISVQLMND